MTIQNYLFEEKKPVQLSRFRVCLGFVMLLYFAYLTQGWSLAWEWLTAKGFHVSGTLLPSIPVTVLLPPSLVPAFGVLFFGAILLWIRGVYLRLTGWLVLLCVLYVTHADILAHYSINRFFIISLLVLAVSGHGKPSVWPLRILQIFFVVQYFIAGWSKAYYGDWLQNPDTLLNIMQIYYMNNLTSWLVYHMPAIFWQAAQLAVVGFELFAPVLLMYRKTLPIGMAWGIGLHLGIGFLMQDLIFFSLAMMSFYVLFLPDTYPNKQS